MSRAKDTFKQSIQDAENLLLHFNALNTKPPPPELEVLKRAGLIMAMTAWETYVEDRLLEASSARLESVADSAIAEFIEMKLNDEIKRLHNPTAHKTIELFRDFAGVDLKESWHWNNYDLKATRERLNRLLKLRGDVVHRSRPKSAAGSATHPVTKTSLEKAISFLKDLVDATERSFANIEQGRRVSG